tara:strand:- start:4550 stop:4945 length:396 start_codon:yes stop_codon:yes gene_type:complete
MINAIGIALTGLNSASLRLNASASNIANINTVGSLTDTNNAPYTPVSAQSSSLGTTGGVRTDLLPRSPAFVPAYDPNSPFADANGIIGVPNTDLAEEIVNAKLAEISYKANLKTIETAGTLFDSLLDAFDD